MPEEKGNGEEATPKTLDAIMAQTWDETMGEDRDEIPEGNEHLFIGEETDEESEDKENDEEDLSEETEDDQESEEELSTSEEESADEETDEDEQEQEDTALSAPEHWSKEDREMFDDLDDGAQEFLLRRHKQMEGDYTRKTQENAEAIKVGRIINDGMDPGIRADLSRIGVDNESYVRQMMQWHHMSATNPTQFVQTMMQQLRLDPAQVFGENWDQNQEETDPMAKRVAAVETHLTQEQQNRQNEAIQKTTDMVNAFKDEVDDKGKPVHPHFERVRGVMAQFVRVDPGMSLKDAYEAAVFKDPELRAEMVAKPAPRNKGDSDHAARVQKARRAKKANIKSKPGSVEQKKERKSMSLTDSLAAAADEVGLQ